MALRPVLVLLFGSLCSCGHKDASDFHGRASLTIGDIIKSDAFDFATFAFIAGRRQGINWTRSQYAYHAAEVYFARFEREVSGASCAGLFCDKFNKAL
jgi:hypothetical protein